MVSLTIEENINKKVNIILTNLFFTRNLIVSLKPDEIKLLV